MRDNDKLQLDQTSKYFLSWFINKCKNVEKKIVLACVVIFFIVLALGPNLEFLYDN